MPPAAPISPIRRRIRSLGVTPSPHLAVEGDAQGLRAALHAGSAWPARAPARSSRRRRRARPGRRACRCGCRRRRSRQPGSAQPELGPHHVHDALAGLVDVEEADARLLGLDAQRREQLGADLGGAGSPPRAGDGVVGGRERQLRAVHLDAATLQIEQAARAAEIVQQMPVHVQQVGVVPEIGDHVAVPDLGKQGAGGHGERLVPYVDVGDSRDRVIRLVNVTRCHPGARLPRRTAGVAGIQRPACSGARGWVDTGDKPRYDINKVRARP